MQTLDDLYGPFTYSWKLVIILFVIAFVIVLIFIFDRFFLDKVKNIWKKKQVPNLKKKYLNKLARLLNKIENNQLDLREAYLGLSVIIREFIDKVAGINVSMMSKNEAKKLDNNVIGELMEEYYPPEFSKYSKGDIINSIRKAMEVIRRWN